MKQAMAKSVANQLEDDDRVSHAEVTRNDKGMLVKATCVDRMAARSLRGDLHQFPVYVEVVS